MPNDLDSRKLDAFLKFVSACTPLATLNAFLDVLAEDAQDLVDFKRLSILLCNDNRQVLRIITIEHHAWREVSAGEIHQSEMDAMLQVLIAGVVSSGRAAHCAPMQSNGRMIGVLLPATRSGEFTDQDARIIQFLADFLAATFDRLAQVRAVPESASHLLHALDTPEVTSMAIHETSLRMSHLAYHDALTNLPNRLLLNDRLAGALALSSRYHRSLAVLFLDVDGFKQVNDTLGHVTGDEVLREIADRLVTCVRSSDTVSRTGGDEFVILLTELRNPEDAAISTGKIIAAVGAPIQVAGYEVRITMSIGVSIYPGDGEDADALIKNADTAMYHAKAAGLGKCLFFREEMNFLAHEHELLADGLVQALDRKEFVLRYQPKVDLRTGAIVGSEALVRWLHPDRGMLFPHQFFPIAEQSGLIVGIGRWALAEACRQAQGWQDAGLPALPISVNFSSTELLRKDFAESVQSILEDSRLQARYLDVEVREATVMHELEPSISILQRLRAIGVGLTLDHFGTGCSVLNYLARLPIDAFKVDPSVIQKIAPDSSGIFHEDGGLIGSVIVLGDSLRRRVVVDGIETSEQFVFLRGQNCREGQGSYFCPPLGAEQFAGLLAKGSVRPELFNGRRNVQKGSPIAIAQRGEIHQERGENAK